MLSHFLLICDDDTNSNRNSLLRMTAHTTFNNPLPTAFDWALLLRGCYVIRDHLGELWKSLLEKFTTLIYTPLRRLVIDLNSCSLSPHDVFVSKVKRIEALARYLGVDPTGTPTVEIGLLQELGIFYRSPIPDSQALDSFAASIEIRINYLSPPVKTIFHDGTPAVGPSNESTELVRFRNSRFFDLCRCHAAYHAMNYAKSFFDAAGDSLSKETTAHIVLGRVICMSCLCSLIHLHKLYPLITISFARSFTPHLRPDVDSLYLRHYSLFVSGCPLKICNGEYHRDLRVGDLFHRECLNRDGTVSFITIRRVVSDETISWIIKVDDTVHHGVSFSRREWFTASDFFHCSCCSCCPEAPVGFISANSDELICCRASEEALLMSSLNDHCKRFMFLRPAERGWRQSNGQIVQSMKCSPLFYTQILPINAPVYPSATTAPVFPFM
jgi:hypothetical protein